MKKGRMVLILILLMAVVGGAVAYMMWNKPHKKAEDVAGIAVTTTVLAQDYTTDEAAANTKYLDKVLDVTGVVKETANNQDNKLVVTLDNDIQCTMRDAGEAPGPGQNITIKGFCNGNDMFGVLLSDCVIVK